MAFSPDGSLVASGGEDATVRVWEARADGATRLTYDGHDWDLHALSWSPDGTRLASAGCGPLVRIWEAAMGRDLFQVNQGAAETVDFATYFPDGRSIATCGSPPGYPSSVHLWEAATGQGRACFALRYVVNALAWSPDGATLALGGDCGAAQLLYAPGGELVSIYPGHGEDMIIWHVAFSPGGALVASAGEDRAVHVWDAETGRLLYVYRGHDLDALGVAWSPDGARRASVGSSDGSVHVWRLSPPATESAAGESESGAIYEGPFSYLPDPRGGQVRRSLRNSAWDPRRE